MIDQPYTQPITPYLTVKGASDAIAFYQRAFNATETARMPFEDGKRLMHAAVSINGGTVMLSDEFPEFGDKGGTAEAPSPERPASAAVVITYAAPAEVDATYARAVDAGCYGAMPPEDAFWGARFAMLRDPFGHRWMLSAELPKA